MASTSKPDPGSSQALELLTRHSNWLTGLARALAREDADDVVQQTIAHALAAPPRHAGNLRGWLGRVLRNVVRARVRADERRSARELLAPRPDPPGSPEE